MIDKSIDESLLNVDKKPIDRDFQDDIENFNRFSLFNLHFEIPFLVISLGAFFINFSILYICIYAGLILNNVAILYCYKLTSIENMLLFVKIYCIGILLDCIIHSIGLENSKLCMVFLVLGAVGNCLGFYSCFLTCKTYYENLNKNIIKPFKKKLKFIDAMFGSLANLFLLFSTMLIFELHEDNNSFELVGRIIIFIHEVIYGGTLLIINICASIIIQFIQNRVIFYILFAGKVVVGTYFSYCSTLNCNFDSKNQAIWHLSFCILGGSFMLVDFIQVFRNTLYVKDK